MLSPALRPQFRLQQILVALSSNTHKYNGATNLGNSTVYGNPFSKFLSTLSQPTDALAVGTNPKKDNSEAVVALFSRYGFSSADTTAVLTKNPRLLSSNPEKTLEPKLAFLSKNGIRGVNLARILSKDPRVLSRSIDRNIAPCIRLLKGILRGRGGGGDATGTEIAYHFSLRHGTRVLHQFSEAMAPNIETLQSHGVPRENIERMLEIRPRPLARDVAQFAEIVKTAKEIGLDTSSMGFIRGVAALSGMKKEKWESKIEVFKSLGWSDEQVRALIIKQPRTMDAAAERLRKSLEFLSEELGWGPDQILRYPVTIMLSLEKRMVPRYTVMKKLMEKGVFDKKRMGTAFYLVEDKFVKKYVEFYSKDIPQLLDLYQNKVQS